MDVKLGTVDVVSGVDGIRMSVDVTNNSAFSINCDVVLAVLYPSTGAIELIVTIPVTLEVAETKTVTHSFSALEVEETLEPGLHDAYAVIEYDESILDEKLLPGEINIVGKVEIPWWLIIPVAIGGGYLIKKWQSHR